MINVIKALRPWENIYLRVHTNQKPAQKHENLVTKILLILKVTDLSLRDLLFHHNYVFQEIIIPCPRRHIDL